MAKITKEDALRYHAEGKPGKIEVIPTKPYSTDGFVAGLFAGRRRTLSGNREESVGCLQIYF